MIRRTQLNLRPKSGSRMEEPPSDVDWEAGQRFKKVKWPGVSGSENKSVDSRDTVLFLSFPDPLISNYLAN